jgi:hypothetical protein
MPSTLHDRALLFKRIGPLGFGGATLGNLYQPISDAQAQATLATALKGGIGYVDTAPFYGFGLSEKRIGRVLAEHDPDSYVVISSKVGRTRRHRRAAAKTPATLVHLDPILQKGAFCEPPTFRFAPPVLVSVHLLWSCRSDSDSRQRRRCVG